jgi:predicted  nucleic acid-binding Zn-ribbon protein
MDKELRELLNRIIECLEAIQSNSMDLDSIKKSISRIESDVSDIKIGLEHND